MTIITQPITEKEKKQKLPLVLEVAAKNAGVGGGAKEKEAAAAANSLINHDVEGGGRYRPVRSSLMVTVMKNRAQRVSRVTTYCVFLTALLVFATGIIGGVYLFRQFNNYKVCAS